MITLLLITSQRAHAQILAIDRFELNGGAANLTGGNFALFGSIGQADAGNLAGDRYHLQGGFFVSQAVSRLPAPKLRLALQENTVVISWPIAAGGFVLEMTDALNPIVWGVVPQIPVVTGTEQSVTVTLSGSSRFYRLRQRTEP